MDHPPTHNINTIVKAQIVFLLSTLTEENFERNQSEIRSVCRSQNSPFCLVLTLFFALALHQLSEQHGVDTYLHFIRRLIAHPQVRQPPSASTPIDASNALAFRLLTSETQRLARDPYLAERFRDAVVGGEGDFFKHFDLSRFVDLVHLRPLERFIVASAIVTGPARTRQELLTQAINIIQAEFDNAVVALCRPNSFDNQDLPLKLALKLLINFFVDTPADLSVLTIHQRATLIMALQSKYGRDAIAPRLPTLFANLRFAF